MKFVQGQHLEGFRESRWYPGDGVLGPELWYPDFWGSVISRRQKRHQGQAENMVPEGQAKAAPSEEASESHSS